MSKFITALVLCLQLFTFAYAHDFSEMLTEAQNGDERAQSLLSNYYKQHNDPNKALYWAQKAAEQDLPYAYVQVGLLYISNFQDNENYQKAFELFNKASSAGGEAAGMAQNELAYMYINGLGVEKNYQKAYDLLTQAIINFPPAYYNLGDMIYYGYISSPDKKLGFKYFTRAAEAREGNAQTKLAAFYWVGVDGIVDPNPPLSYAWNYLADQNGIALTDAEKQEYEAYFAKDPLCRVVAYNDIGAFYMNGTGIDKDYHKAFAWFQKSHQLAPDLPLATLNLAKLYSLGHGTSQDFNKALELLDQAANQPYGPAQQFLGLLYLQGSNHGFEDEDPVKAYTWLKLAAYTYDQPNQAFIDSFHSNCVTLAESDNLQNAHVANYYAKQAYDSLTADQKKAAEALFEKLKAKQLAQKY